MVDGRHQCGRRSRGHDGYAAAGTAVKVGEAGAGNEAAFPDAVAEALPAESAAGARVAEIGRFYRFLAARMPSLLDEWERERESWGRDTAPSSAMSPGGSP